MDGLRKKLKLEVSEEEVDVFFEKRAGQLGLQTAELKRSPRADDLRRELEDDKIFEYLSEHADVKEQSV